MAGLHDYGSLLLASRLRRVSDLFYAGVDEVYRSQGVELSSRCFPILFLLRDQGRLGISELAAQLGQSHPAVNQMSSKLLKHAVVREWPDPKDARRRLLGLSRRGASLMARLEPVWQGIREAVGELEGTHPVADSLAAIDQALEARGFAARIQSRLMSRAPVQIVPFQRRYAPHFARLNLQWLERYFRVEPIDRRVLSHPQRIVRAGGAVFFARYQRDIVGTCALLKTQDGRFELSKMAVTDGCQRLGIGRKLLAAAIETFRARGGAELFLETNSLLKPAIALYESMGFVRAQRPHPSHYQRSDVYMLYRGGP